MARPDLGAREDGREFRRIRPREPHEKFHIDRSDMSRGMDYFWAATKIRGMPNPRFTEYWRSGWRPVKAEQFPELSGLDLDIDPELAELGIIREVKADSHIINDDLMLMVRPKEMSDEARAEDKKHAEAQVEDHLRTVTAKSRRAIGERATQVSRRYGTGAPDEALPDDEAEI